MTRLRFDPEARARQEASPDLDPSEVVGWMLWEYLGGDPLTEARRRARRDPVLRARLAAAAHDLAECAERLRERPAEGSDD
jgi:hypothetical protein